MILSKSTINLSKLLGFRPDPLTSLRKNTKGRKSAFVNTKITDQAL